MSWTTVKIADLATVASGGGAPQDSDAFSAEGIPFVRAGSLVKLLAGQTENSLELLKPDVAADHKLKLFPAGTVLFAKSGMSATKGHVYQLKKPAYVVNHLAALTPRSKSAGDYLRHVLRFKSPTCLIKDEAYPSIRLGDIENMEVPAPRADSERQRIAAILDQADELRRIRQRAMGRLNHLSQAIFYEMFDAKLKLTVPDATIGAISERVTKGESPKWQGHSYVDEGALFVTSENVGWGMMLEKTPKFIPFEFHETKLRRSKLRNGDILINLVGASIGRACIFESRYTEANINQAVAVVTVKENAPLSGYLLTYILSPIGQEQILGSRVEGARANISLRDVREFKFHMPSSSELIRFSEAKKEVARTIERAGIALTHSTSLFSSLQNRAFQGEL